jgi:chemotaxis protein methyltransferase CheR
MIAIDNKLEFESFKKLAKDEFGLEFSSQNEHLLVSAINTRIKTTGVSSSLLYFQHLKDNSKELAELVCLLTNNETYFFREASHFKFMWLFLEGVIKN